MVAALIRQGKVNRIGRCPRELEIDALLEEQGYSENQIYKGFDEDVEPGVVADDADSEEELLRRFFGTVLSGRPRRKIRN